VTIRLLGVSGSPRARSKTLLAIQETFEHVRAALPAVSVEALNLCEWDLQLCDGRDPSLYSGDTRRVIDAVVEADALIFGTPVYRGSYTATLKNLFDVIPNDALRGKPVGLVATGGTDHHYLVIEHELKPLMGFFDAYVVPGSVYVNNQHYARGALVAEDAWVSLRRLGVGVVEFAQRIPRDLVPVSPPNIPRQSLDQT
jgi:MsuE subfamily FMN reductase